MEDISKVKYLYIILNSPISSQAMSGGDKIFIKISELLTLNLGYKVVFLCCPNSYRILKNSTKVGFEYILINNIHGDGKNIVLTYLHRLIFLYRIFFIPIKKGSYIISASDFLTDSLPLFMLFLKFGKELNYFTSLFLRKKFEFEGGFHSLLYFLSQQITILITRICGFKILTNLIDQEYLISKGIKKKSVIVLSGGIEDFNEVVNTKIYDGCFIGRISKQKGLDLLLKICKEVVSSKKNFKLSLIVSGTDNEVRDLKKEISNFGLEDNIIFFGFLDNNNKYRVLSQSKILLFPSRNESFGIVVAESLNLEVPVVAFELEALKMNFSNGIVYSKNIKEFKENVISLITKKSYLQKLGIEGKKSVQKYNWKSVVKNFSEVLV